MQKGTQQAPAALKVQIEKEMVDFTYGMTETQVTTLRDMVTAYAMQHSEGGKPVMPNYASLARHVRATVK